MVALGEMLVGKEMTVHQSATHDVTVVVLNLIEFLAYFTLVVVLGFDQRLSVETRKSVDARDFALLAKRGERNEMFLFLVDLRIHRVIRSLLGANCDEEEILPFSITSVCVCLRVAQTTLLSPLQTMPPPIKIQSGVFFRTFLRDRRRRVSAEEETSFARPKAMESKQVSCSLFTRSNRTVTRFEISQ